HPKMAAPISTVCCCAAARAVSSKSLEHSRAIAFASAPSNTRFRSEMRAKNRTGILGGTFDPVHVGHLEIARGALAAAPLDRVLFMPVGAPAHRETHAPAADRAEMVR